MEATGRGVGQSLKKGGRSTSKRTSKLSQVYSHTNFVYEYMNSLKPSIRNKNNLEKKLHRNLRTGPGIAFLRNLQAQILKIFLLNTIHSGAFVDSTHILVWHKKLLIHHRQYTNFPTVKHGKNKLQLNGLPLSFNIASLGMPGQDWPHPTKISSICSFNRYVPAFKRSVL